jgi:DNA-binding transcriptional LysR family regulator
MRPNIQAMDIFVRTVETNSFIGAARSLLIDPAAVSRTIKALETDLWMCCSSCAPRGP